MKKVLFVLALVLLMADMAQATERSPLTGQVINNIQSHSSAQATGGNAGSVSNSNDFNAAAASAIAPSVGTNNNCLIATPSSAAVNILFGGISKTTGFHYSGLCLAYRMENYELAEKLMCLEDKNFAKLNPKCSK